jgi:cephalosporin hydroxylase
VAGQKRGGARGREVVMNGQASEVVNAAFFEQLVRHTDNFSRVSWLGCPIWQNILDLWVIQETICELRPELLIECGTYRGGSAYFYATLLSLLHRGRVITIDVEPAPMMNHPLIEFIVGSSLSETVVDRVRRAVATVAGSIMVILDSDHAAAHVKRELELYSSFVTRGSFILVQDGVIDVLPIFGGGRPGPLPAIREFLRGHPEFEVDAERSARFLISHHPSGWLRRLL